MCPDDAGQNAFSDEIAVTTGLRKSAGAATDARIPLWISALGVTSVMQVTSAFLTTAMPVIAPTLTASAGVAPERVGHLTAMGSLGTMLFLVIGGPLLVRFGPV